MSVIFFISTRTHNCGAQAMYMGLSARKPARRRFESFWISATAS